MLRLVLGTDNRMTPDFWAHVLRCWPPDELYLFPDPHPVWRKNPIFARAQAVDSLKAIPGELVVFSPPDAGLAPGALELEEFDHPANALYFFGADHRILELEDLGRRPDNVVCIATSGHQQLHAHVAAGIVLHDRERRLFAA